MSVAKNIELYKKLYKLPTITYKEKVCDGLINLYKKTHFFVVIAIYNQKNELFLIRDFNKNIGWELPGGYIKNEENIIDSVQRIIIRETGLEVNEIEPIAVVKNIFVCMDRTIENVGIAFLARTKGRIREYPENIKGCFVSYFSCKLAYQNNKIVRLAQIKIKRKKSVPPQGEIDSIKSPLYRLSYFIHRLFIKPIGNFSSKKIESEIIKLIDKKPKTILDVSCGDSQIINKLGFIFSPEICVGNDISWKTISTIKNKNFQTVFTNHNILELPFCEKFDLVIFKNTLHHIQKQKQKSVLRCLGKISKQLLVIDVDNPNRSSFISRMWNNYYIHFLKDQGKYFLTTSEFENVLDSLFGKQKINIKKITTIKGDYYIASIKISN